MKFITQEIALLATLFVAKVSAHGTLRTNEALDTRHLQDVDSFCTGCQTCAELGPTICDVSTITQLVCDNCDSLNVDGLCDGCTVCGDLDEFCNPQAVAELGCNELCGVDIADTTNDFVGGLVEGLDLCFSEIATVQVLNKGTLTMKDLKIGDQVMTEQGVYEYVYAFGHHHPTKLATFLQIFSENNRQPLEITADHLVFLKDKSIPVAASYIQVGDVLRGHEGVENKVTKISSVQRQGIYAPLTMQGSLLVDGVSASSYIRINGSKDSFMLTDHDLIHLALSPYRMLCNGVSTTFCGPGSYHKESGMPFYAYFGLGLLRWLSQCNIIIKTFGISIILGLVGTCQLFENLFGASHAPLALGILGAVYVSKKNAKQAKAV